MIQYATPHRYAVKIFPESGQSVKDCMKRLDEQWPEMLADLGLQLVGTGVGLKAETRVLRHDRPGDQPHQYPFEIRREAWVADASLPARWVERWNPRIRPYLAWEDDDATATR